MRSSPHLLASCNTADPETGYRRAESAIWEELTRCLDQYPQAWNSPEEGAMLLAEELDELWDEVRGNRLGLARAEATQVGAMAVRFIADIYGGNDSPRERCHTVLIQQRGIRSSVGPAGRLCSSSHEAFGFLRREFDALWSAVLHVEDARSPAIRMTAAAVRFIAEAPAAPTRAGVTQR